MKNKIILIRFFFQMSHSIKSGKTNGHQHKKEQPSSSDDDNDEPIRAPLQLKLEVKK